LSAADYRGTELVVVATLAGAAYAGIMKVP